MRSFTLVPAYGRDYKSKAAVLADFNAGKDFQDMSFDASGTYINLQDILACGGGRVTLRYQRLTKVVVATVRPE